MDEQAQAVKKGLPQWVQPTMMMLFIVALFIAAVMFGKWSASCEISSIQQYIEAGGRMVANESGIFDYGILKSNVPLEGFG